jgi:hypothetical protein
MHLFPNIYKSKKLWMWDMLLKLLGTATSTLTPKGPRVFWCKTTQNYPF